ncbi:uncharacterized protein [Primulina huaijiensis]|uniref:uncharacterized protein isoform X1 n=3 Tax=Primulina TaxID=48772 RepID=UPI003CC6F6C2
MAAQEEEDSMAMDPHQLEIPTRRVKNIMKLDKDINKVNSEALHLIACSTELFIEFLAEKSARVALEKKKKTIRLEHLRVAVKRHQPTGDFLLSSLPKPSMPYDQQLPKDRVKTGPSGKPVPFSTRRIDAFFQKCT